jgi:CRP-like cAMP-binding protein
MSQLQQSAVRNRLLAALPPHDFDALAPALDPVELELRQVLYEPGQAIRAVLFPENGMISNIVLLEDGHSVEVGIIGREGLVGLPVVLGAERSSTQTLVQAGGSALRLRTAAVRAAFDRSAPLRAVLLRYVQAFHAQVTQSAACNAQHKVDERLARWLLIMHDRVGEDEFPVTHEFLALMLAARRPSISVAAGALQKAGAIRYTHGQMVVLDRGALEAAACECYGAVRDQFENLLGAPVG